MKSDTKELREFASRSETESRLQSVWWQGVPFAPHRDELLSRSLRQFGRPAEEANALTKCKSSEREKLGAIIVTYIRKVYLQGT